jgi:predicted metal-binding protein
MKPTTIYVCTTCRGPNDADARPGRQFLEALQARLQRQPESAVAAEGVECLSICKRPASLAFAGVGKWTYTLTGLELPQDVEEVIAAAKLHAAAPDGVAAWKDRPACFKRNVVARTPPFPQA